jgi:hypothetical protein
MGMPYLVQACERPRGLRGKAVTSNVTDDEATRPEENTEQRKSRCDRWRKSAAMSTNSVFHRDSFFKQCLLPAAGLLAISSVGSHAKSAANVTLMQKIAGCRFGSGAAQVRYGPNATLSG